MCLVALELMIHGEEETIFEAFNLKNIGNLLEDGREHEAIDIWTC